MHVAADQHVAGQMAKTSDDNYRPDIDGIRAIAIIAVVAFHAFPQVIKGGFIGVDIFFVISGFLISGIIFRALESSSFSFTEFFSRRIRRIFPALLLVMLSTLTAGWFLLFPDEYRQLAQHALAGAGFFSNFLYWSERGYFDNAAELKPFLHLWSLGVEEQFYVVGPLLFWAAWGKRFGIKAFLVVGIAISFLLNIAETHADKVGAFYLPVPRFWELFAGSFLAWMSLGKATHQDLVKKWHVKPFDVSATTASHLLSLSGAALMVTGLLFTSREKYFPGWWAILPVWGTVLLIQAGRNAWVNHRLLSSAPMVWIGQISFPLYLWHWPILAFARIIKGEEPSAGLQAGLLCVSVVLAWLTYSLLELPVRRRRVTPAGIAGLLAMMAAIGCAALYIYSRDGLDHREIAKIQKRNDFRFPPPFRNKCPLAESADSGDWCNDGNTPKNPEVVLLGDSYATSYSQMLLNLDKAFPVSFKQYGRGQCPPLLDFGPRVCTEASRYYLDLVLSSSAKTVILAAAWPAYVQGKNYDWLHLTTTAKDFDTSFKKTLALLELSGKRVVVFLAPPSGAMPRNCLGRQKRLSGERPCSLDLSTAAGYDRGSRDAIKQIVSGFPAVRLFDPYKHLCDDTSCKVIDGEKILYIDADHMSAFGGDFLATHAGPELKQLLGPR